MEKKIRIQDDLYHYVNGQWLEKAVIPEDRSSVGGFADLDIALEKMLMQLFKDMAEGKVEIPNENFGKAIAIYKAAMNTKKRDEDGIKPILKDLHAIQAVKDIAELNEKARELALRGMRLPFNYGVDVDMKNSLVHSFILTGSSTILPDTTYYAEDNKQGPELLKVWKEMALELLAYTDLSKEEQEDYVNAALAYDKEIAKHAKSSIEWADYIANYNPMKFDEICSLLAPFDFKKFMTDIYGDKLPEQVIVYEPRALKELKEVWNESSFENYKKWAYVKCLLGNAGYLTEEMRWIAGKYSRTLSGNPKSSSLEKYAYKVSSGTFSEVVGMYYGQKYFGEEAKADVIEMVKEIIETYKKRIAKNTFLEEKTKEKAILKLSTMKIKMGYPDKADPFYDELKVDPSDSYYDMLDKIGMQGEKHSLEKLYKPVDRSEWGMPGHLVNACYNPSANDITFPAAILQAPFYSLKQKREENLGGIGAVIGHEISHAFDNNGARCDENGNLANWWTEEDYKKFKELTKGMIDQFEGIEINGGKVSGELVVSENIADNGGMAVTLEIMSTMKDADYEAYFKNWGRIWCMKGRPEYLKLLLSVDVHSPVVLRANMQPRNFAEWYKTFDVKETDKMYIAPEKRICIW